MGLRLIEKIGRGRETLRGGKPEPKRSEASRNLYPLSSEGSHAEPEEGAFLGGGSMEMTQNSVRCRGSRERRGKGRDHTKGKS